MRRRSTSWTLCPAIRRKSPPHLLGPRGEFLAPEMRLSVEFLADQPVSVIFPDQLEIKVADTSPSIHGQGDNTWKDAKLDNGAACYGSPIHSKRGCYPDRHDIRRSTWTG